MKKTFKLLKEDFESSSVDTSQCKEFRRIFKREFRAAFSHLIKRMEFSKGHFTISGFIELNDGRVFYLSVGDFRWFKETMLIRTAKDFKDWTGGQNQYVSLRDPIIFGIQLLGIIS